MSDPLTPMKVLAIPLNGTDAGTWDQPVNNNQTAIDGMLGGLVTKSLTNLSITLTKPTGTVTPGAGPTESQNAILRFTGTLTAPCQVTVPLPGYYIADNRCTVGSSNYIFLVNGGGGEGVGLPPGRPVHVYSDGTNVRFVNMPEVGSYMDLAVSSVPIWIAACSVRPWLFCDGTVYNTADYPFLGALLGSTFGGNGSTTFGVPDARNRVRVSVGANLLSLIGSDAVGVFGGAQYEFLTAAQMPLQTTGTESGSHIHTISITQAGIGYASGVIGLPYVAGGVSNTGIESALHTHQVGNASPSAVTTVQPTLIAGMTFIKT